MELMLETSAEESKIEQVPTSKEVKPELGPV